MMGGSSDKRVAKDSEDDEDFEDIDLDKIS
jgi:hypothetical protein